MLQAVDKRETSCDVVFTILLIPNSGPTVAPSEPVSNSGPFWEKIKCLLSINCPSINSLISIVEDFFLCVPASVLRSAPYPETWEQIIWCTVAAGPGSLQLLS